MIDLLENDQRLWELWLSRFDLPAIAVSDYLNIFLNISQERNTIPILSADLTLDAHCLQALLCYLTSLGLLNKNISTFQLTDLAKKYLLPTSEYYWGPALFRTRESQEFERILKSLTDKQRSQLIIDNKNVTNMWEAGKIDFETAKYFTSVMHCTVLSAATIAVNADVFKFTKSLLDVGGGSGCFASLFIKKYMNVSAGIFELPEVCEVAKEFINEDNISDKIQLYPGNFFKDDFPSHFAGILFSNILHDWPIETAKFLLKKAYNALPDGGRIYINEILLNENKDGPKVATAFNLLMSMNHHSQQFTEREVIDMLNNIGFINCDVIRFHPFFSMIIAQKS